MSTLCPVGRSLLGLAALLLCGGCSLPQKSAAEKAEQARREAELRAKVEDELRAKLEAETRAKDEARANAERLAKEKQAEAEGALATAKTEPDGKAEEDPLIRKAVQLKLLVEGAKKQAVEADDFLLSESKKLSTKANEASQDAKVYKVKSDVLRRNYETATQNLNAAQVNVVAQCVTCRKEQARAKSCVFCGGELRTVDKDPEGIAKAQQASASALKAFQTETQKYNAAETLRRNVERDISAIESLRLLIRKGFDKLAANWEAWIAQKAQDHDVTSAVSALNLSVGRAKGFLPAGTKPPPLAPLSTLGDPAKPAAPAAPRPAAKVYVMKDGTRIEVASEVNAGDEIVLKKPNGEMVTVKTADVERTEKP